MLHILHHCASKYSVGLNTHSWNTKHFEVRISSGSILEWSVIAIAIAMVLNIPKQNHWKSEQNSSHFVPTEHHWITEGHCQTKQRATIGILNAFDIPALTVHLSFQCFMLEAISSF